MAAPPEPEPIAEPARPPERRRISEEPVPVSAARIEDDWELEPTPEELGDPARAPEPMVASPEQAPAEPRPWVLPTDRGRKRRTVIAVCGLIIVGGMAVAIVDSISPSRPSNVAASEPPAPTREPSSTARVEQLDDVAAAAPIEPKALYAAAIRTLRDLRSSPSRRVVRLATMALARSGDDEATAGITELLETEESALNRIALAYALARAGGSRGRDELIAGLEHKRRDVRSDAAIGLLQLGDEAGLKTLQAMMMFRHHKLAACSHLARAGDVKAKAALMEVYGDAKEDPESRLRAAVALGRSGDASVAEFLRGTLDDGRFQVGAADALAALGDRSSIAPLTVQLGLNAMRVRAAIALRSLDAEVSLEPLAVALTEDDEVTRVTAAEAILVLTGPKENAQRD